MKKIAIYGGTHGNEWTGVFIVQNMKFSHPKLLVDTYLSNEEAYKQNKRYLDTDLNRCFEKQDIQNLELKNREQSQAKDIAQNVRDYDFVIDLHTTTSQMGPTLILTREDEETLRVCKQAQKYYPEIKIIFEYGDPYLVSYAKKGVIIEVGPCPQGVLKDVIIEQTTLCIEALLKSVADFNAEGSIGDFPAEAYKVVQKVDYPRGENGKIMGYVHKYVQDSCFKYLKIGDPLFKSFENLIIHNDQYEGYPIFVNEAAYYEKGVAFVLTEKIKC